MKKLRLPYQNFVLLTGRLTQEPELRYTPSGHAVCRLRLAVNRRYKDSEGKFQEETCFVPVIIWRQTALTCSEKLYKGSPILVEGRLRSRDWIDKDGRKQHTLEIVARRVQILEYEAAPEEEVAPAVPEVEETTEEYESERVELLEE